MRINISLKTIAPLALVLGAIFAAWPVASNAADDYVVIVNKSNTLDSIRASDLRKIFTGETTTWANGAKMAPITPSPESPEYGPVIKKATGMSASDFKRCILQLMFTGKAVTPPRTLDTAAAAAKYVSTSPGAISCVPAAEAGASVKTLKVE